MCVTGVPMDVYCIIVGSMLDNGLTTLEYAHEHTIHCLVDVSFCRNSGFEILEPNGNGSYNRAVVLDEFGNEEVIRIARSVGQCSTCTGEGTQRKNFFVTVEGELVDATSVGVSDADPPLLRVTRMSVDATCPTPTMAPTTQLPTTPAPIILSIPEPTSSAPSIVLGVESLVPSTAENAESVVPTEIDTTGSSITSNALSLENINRPDSTSSVARWNFGFDTVCFLPVLALLTLLI